jgi:hypothetical protein
MRVSYGLPVLEFDDPYIALAEETVRGAAEAGIPGTFLVDLLPLLKYVPSWFPGAGFKRMAAHYAAVNAEVVDRPFNIIQRKMVSS